jgi:hypothetical protein
MGPAAGRSLGRMSEVPAMRSQPHSSRSAAAVQILAGVAAITIGVASVWADPAMPAGGPQPSPEINPPGPVLAAATNRPSDADDAPLTPATPDMKAVQDLLGRAIDDATTSGRSADLLTLLARRDRDRINTPGDWSDVDHAADGFRAAWRARFGLRFKVRSYAPSIRR